MKLSCLHLLKVKVQAKWHSFSHSAGLKSKYSHFYGRNKMSKHNKIQKKNLSTKLLFPQKDENTLTTLLHSADDLGLLMVTSYKLEIWRYSIEWSIMIPYPKNVLWDFYYHLIMFSLVLFLLFCFHRFTTFICFPLILFLFLFMLFVISLCVVFFCFCFVLSCFVLNA